MSSLLGDVRVPFLLFLGQIPALLLLWSCRILWDAWWGGWVGESEDGGPKERENWECIHKLETAPSRRATSEKTLQIIVIERWGSHGVQPGVHEVGPSPRSPPLGIPPLPPSPLPIVLPSHPLPPQYICVPEPLLEASGPFTHLEVSAGGGGARHHQSSNAGPPAFWPAPLPGEGRPRD